MTHDSIQNWVDKYVEAWRSKAPSKLYYIFSGKVSYKESPWSQAIKGLSDLQDFWEQACSRQGSFKLQSKVVAVEGNTAVVRLNIHYTTDTPSRWRDLWILTFEDEGLCSSYEGWPLPQE